jgi:leader peptidase (prepilin peptidase)/N-methyltransferase
MQGDIAADLLSQAGFQLLIVIFSGLCLGSFASALSYRLPLGQSIFTKTRSACPFCDRTLGVFDLVPIFSWLFLKGRCRGCKAKIGWRYPLIESATLVTCLLFYFIFGFHFVLVPLFFLAAILVSIVDIDFKYKMIPDGLNISIAVLGFVAIAALSLNTMQPVDFFVERSLEGLGAAVAYAAGSLLLRAGVMAWLKKDPLGLGDVKLFAAMGVWLGFSLDALAWLAVCSGFGSLLIGAIWKKIFAEDEYPFGPAIVFAFIALLATFRATMIMGNSM